MRAVCSAAPERGGGPAAKTIGLVCRLPEKADVPALEEAVRAFAGRHGALHHRFVHRDGTVSLRRMGPPQIRCAVIESDHPDANHLVRAEVDRPFDVLGWPLLRAGLIRADRPLFYLSMDHLVNDGGSMAVAKDEIEALYRSAVTGRPHHLPPPGDFLAYSAAERRRFASGPGLDRQVAAVQRLLAGRPVQPAFGVDARPWDLTTGRYVRLELLDPAGAQAFAERCRAARASVFMGVLAAFGIAVREVTGRGEAGMLVGVHNRDTPDAEQGVGWYANALPLYFPVAPDGQFDGTVRAARQGLMALLDHHRLPLSRLAQSMPDAHYSGVGDRYPTCFVSFTDDRAGTGEAPGDGPAEGWTRIMMAPSYRVGYGLWVSRHDTGLEAVVASPDAPTTRATLAEFEGTLVAVVRRIAGGT